MKKYLLLTALLLSFSFNALCADGEYKDPFSFTKGNTSVKVGGFVWVTLGTYLEGTTTVGDDFPSSSIPTSSTNDYSDSRLILDPSATRLYLDFVQKTEALGDIKVYIEGDFRGVSNAFRLRQAYVKFKGLTIGQTWNIMTDMAANAPTVDIQGIPSRTFFRDAQIAYNYNFNNIWSMAASIDFPSVSITADNYSNQAISRVPDAVMYVQAKGSLGHIRASGVWRTMNYSDELTNSTQTQNGWGVQLSGSLKAAKSLTFYGQGIYGEGIGRYINDLATLSVDLVESNSTQYLFSTLPMSGFSVGANLDLSKKMSLSSCYSQVNVDSKDDFGSEDMYTKGEYLSVAYFYVPLRNLTFGAEYLYGLRKDFGGDKGKAQRLNLYTKFTF